ncbi:MAG: hypothetical protein PHW62_01600 [Candidatus Ratteibacteria bacterium]|nr:hypothetical protein [Candidatus Ratteibacteria bacterium]
MTSLKHRISQINAQSVVLDRLNFLIQEETNLADGALLWTVEYCAKNNIPIHEEKRFKNIVADSKRIIAEIKKTSDTLGSLCKISLSEEDLKVP